MSLCTILYLLLNSTMHSYWQSISWNTFQTEVVVLRLFLRILVNYRGPVLFVWCSSAYRRTIQQFVGLLAVAIAFIIIYIWILLVPLMIYKIQCCSS